MIRSIKIGIFQVFHFQRNGKVGIFALLGSNFNRVVRGGNLSNVVVIGIFEGQRKALLILIKCAQVLRNVANYFIGNSSSSPYLLTVLPVNSERIVG